MTTRANGARGPGRPPIGRERILAGAQELVERRGAEALSLRALADHLGSSTSTLYRYVSGRAELVGILIDRVISEAAEQRETVGGSWDEQLRARATALFTALRRNPRLAPLLSESIPAGPATAVARGELIAVLLEAGFDRRTSARVAIMLARYALGFALQSQDQDDPAAPDLDAHPALREVAPHLPVALEEEFATGLELILEGLRSRMSR